MLVHRLHWCPTVEQALDQLVFVELYLILLIIFVTSVIIYFLITQFIPATHCLLLSSLSGQVYSRRWSMFVLCWATVCDAGPTLSQHWLYKFDTVIIHPVTWNAQIATHVRMRVPVRYLEPARYVLYMTSRDNAMCHICTRWLYLKILLHQGCYRTSSVPSDSVSEAI